MIKQLALTFKLVRLPLLFAFPGVLTLLFIYYFDQTSRDNEILDKAMAVWGETLARSLVHEDWLFAAKIGQNLDLNRFICLSITKDELRVFTFPSETTTCSCDNPYTRLIDHYGVTVGKLIACSDNKTKVALALTSSSFQISSLLVLLISTIACLIPLSRYRRSLLETIHFLSKWAENPISKEGPLPNLPSFNISDPLTQKITTLFTTIVEQEVKIQEQKNEMEKQRLITEIATQVSHDIRSPLSALNVAVSRLNDIPTDLLDIINKAIGRINAIVGDLLEKSKASSSVNIMSTSERPPSTKVDKIDLCSLAESMVSEKLTEFSTLKHVRFVVDIESKSDSRIRANASDIERALSNIINNSVEAIETQGTVTIGVRTYQKYVTISVADTGKGIPEEILPRLGKQRFSFGKEQSLKSGTGLGIYQAQKIVERYGGKLTIWSRIGCGTVITMTFPKSD